MQASTIDNERRDGTDLDGDNWKRAAQRALHPTAGVVGADVLAAIAAGLAAVTVPWELRSGEVPTERRVHRVLVTDAYEAWVICWPDGESLEMDEHGGSAGAFSIVSGKLDEATIESGVKVVRTFVPGDTTVFDSSRIHAVANCGDAVATSVHVYSPPLSSMMYYESDDSGSLVAVAEDVGGRNR